MLLLMMSNQSIDCGASKLVTMGNKFSQAFTIFTLNFLYPDGWRPIIAVIGKSDAIITSGVDGKICAIDSLMGIIKNKFMSGRQASVTIATSQRSILVATIAIRVFDIITKELIWKSPIQLAAVRALTFIGGIVNVILSGAEDSRHTSIWLLSKHNNRTIFASFTLQMDSPVIHILTKNVRNNGFVTVIISRCGEVGLF